VRLLRSNLRKLRRRPATWVTFVLLVALLLLVLLAVVVGSQEARNPQAAIGARMFVTFPDAYELLLAMVLGIGGLLAVTYGAAVAGSEWTWGTLKSAIARGESRTRYTVMGFAAVAIFTWMGLVLAYLATVAGAAVGASMIGVSLAGMGDAEKLGRLPELFARAGLATAMNAALGFAVATVTRSQLAGIGVGIGLYFAEGIAGIFLPDVIKWFPFASSSAVVATSGAAAGMGGGGGIGASLDPNTAVLATIGWLVASLLVASLWTERAEIGG
jgi:ABC-2 type transport system permease protein